MPPQGPCPCPDPGQYQRKGGGNEIPPHADDKGLEQQRQAGSFLLKRVAQQKHPLRHLHHDEENPPEQHAFADGGAGFRPSLHHDAITRR